MNNIIKRKWNQNSMVIIEDLQGMAFQAESGGHTFQISGIDGEGNTVALSGTPAGVMLRSDGQDVTLTCSVSEGVVSATLPANAYVVPGRFGLTIFLTSDGQKTAIYAAVGTVGKTSSGTVAPPAGSDVVTLVNQINTAIAAIPANYNACFAPAYSTSGLYSVGQYVTYNGNLYRCNTAITTAETWTSAHWTQTNLGADVYDLKSASIPFPVYPESKYGTNGQLLRTKGDGKTEWADVGLPTDKQTAEAIEAWLDDHPEATTTVQDGSLTDAKFTETLKYQTENDYIIPEMYGAAGDGTTDDASALQSAINYAIANNKPLKLSDGKTYGVSTGLMISGGWLEIKKSTGIIKALNAIDGAVVTIISPNIISDREEIGKRRVLSFNLECNGSSKGIFGHGMFEYIVRDSLIKGAIIGIDMNSPCAEVIFENCYIDGTGISNSTGVLNRAADIVYKNLYMFNCHTAFDITAFCELYNCHPWMDRNIDGSIGIKTTVTCKIADSYIDTYQISIYKSNGANLLLDNTYIYISDEFYTSDLGPAYIFYAENNNDYNYSLLSNLFIAKGGDSITVKLSNLTSFNIAMSNCRIETGIDKSMRTTSTQLKTSNAPLASVSSGVTLREQYGAQNEYGRYIMFVIDVGSSDVNAWDNVATIVSGSFTPKYTATLVGVREDAGNAVLLYANTNGQITTSRNLIAGKKYRISGVYLA